MRHVEQEPGEPLSGGPITRLNILEHLAEMSEELKGLAAKADAPLLVSILDLAHKEAVNRARLARQMTPLSS